MHTYPAATCSQPDTNVEAQLKNLDQFYVRNRSEFLKWAYKTFFLLPDEATDIYQDAVIVLFENYQKGKLVELHATMKTYFYGIAKNLISAYLKRRNKHRLFIDAYGATTSDAFDEMPELARTQEELVEEAVKKLPPRGQSIMHLFYYEKKSLREITHLLGYQNEAVVKSTKMRYKKELRKILEQSIPQGYAA